MVSFDGNLMTTKSPVDHLQLSPLLIMSFDFQEIALVADGLFPSVSVYCCVISSGCSCMVFRFNAFGSDSNK